MDLPSRGSGLGRGPDDGGRPEADHGGQTEGRRKNEETEQDQQKRFGGNQLAR